MDSEYVERTLIGAREHAAWRYALSRCSRHRVAVPGRWRTLEGFLAATGPAPSVGHRISLTVVDGAATAAWLQADGR
jgi:hypothetical protein